MHKKWFFCICFICISFLHCGEILLIGITGGSGSGKTTLASKLYEKFKEEAILISQDNYYKDLSHLSPEDRAKVNFDHPNSIDFVQLQKDLESLRKNRSIEMPIYDFCTHSRKKETISISPKQIIIVEGLLLFTIPELRNQFDLKIFIDADDDIRLLRRIDRDIRERGRGFPSIRDQYLQTVHPMYHEFILPTKRFADLIVPFGGDNPVALQLILSQIQTHLHQ